MTESLDQRDGLSERFQGREEPEDGPTLDLIPDRRASAGANLAVAGMITDEVRASLIQVRGTDGFSVPVLLTAAFHLLLQRYSRRESIRSVVIASSGEGPASSWLSRSITTRAAFSSPFAQILTQVAEGLGSAGSSETLSDAQSSVVVLLSGGGDLAEVAVREAERAGCGQFEILLAARPKGQEMELCLVHHPEQIGSDAATRMMRHLERLLAAVPISATSRISEVPVMDEDEEALVQTDWNDTAIPYPRDASIGRLFAEQVALRPGATAVESGSEALTYLQLDRLSNQVGHLLAGEGVQAGDFVGIAMDRSLMTVACALGVIKAGAAYVPLDPTYPDSRLEFMLQDTGAKVVLTDGEGEERLSELAGAAILIRLDGPDRLEGYPDTGGEVERGGSDLAYVIYTSGSTGRPKGVRALHRGVVRLVKQPNYIRLDENERVMAFAPISFDASTLEIWGPLLNGGVVVVAPPGLLTMEELGRFIEEASVTTLWLTSALFHQVVDSRPESFRAVRQLLAGGDVLSPQHVRKVLETYPDCTVVNGYGPTENTTFTSCHVMTSGKDVGPTVSIGRPVTNTRVYILGPAQELMPVGVPGELYAGGDGVADGYLNRPELTQERFLPDPFDPSGEGRMYRTGDLARWLPDGTLEFLGRIDNQVKIRGFRVELGEIESRLREHTSLRDVVVVAFERDGHKRLAAYVVAEEGVEEAPDPSDLRDFVRGALPEYMVPSFVVPMESLPVTSNGKVDRKALPDPLGSRSRATDTGPSAPTGASRDQPPAPEPLEKATAAEPSGLPTPPDVNRYERVLSGLWSRLLGVTALGPDEGFFDLGGTSLLSLQVLDFLSREEGIEVPVVKFYQHPTVRSLARYLAEEDAKRKEPEVEPAQRGPEQSRPVLDERIAIVGMAGRFPGAPDVDSLWEMLREGRDGRVEYSEEELREAGVPEELIRDPDYVRASYPLDGAGDFDAEFFGFRQREVELMDPQQRLFLEVAWMALENAGYDPRSVPGKVGVFGGVGRNSYLMNNLASHPELAHTLAEHPGLVGNERDFPTTHVSFRLGLTGPSVDVQSACSTSGVALHLARRSLQAGECDVALAGGCKILIPNRVGYLYEEGGALSQGGRIRAFDAGADGMVRGSGGAMLVLKRHGDAVRDGNRILGIVLGSAVNNDGGQRAGFAAPSPEGQARVITAALRDAGIDAETIDYVETHGTGTRLGDPIEIEGLTQAYRRTTEKVGFCGVGSIKSSLGHLDAGAMAAGTIKVLLALQHEELPPSVNFSRPNPHIDFAASPFFVNDRIRPWPRSQRPRRAGISSFGLGGTNAHVIIEEPPPQEVGEPASGEPQLILLSARSEAALAKAAENLAGHLDGPENAVPFPDVAYTLQAGRRRFQHRLALVAEDPDGAVRDLRGMDPKRLFIRNGGPDESRLAFLFPGGGSQYAGMARDLWNEERVFRAAVNRCSDLLEGRLHLKLTELLFDNDRQPEALEEPRLALPALFAVEYALSELWRAWGLEPNALMGHSMGEYTAAHVAGVMSLEDALALVTERGRLFETLPSGSMLVVPLPEKDTEEILSPELSIAAVNRPQATVVSGPTDAIEELEASLESRDLECSRVHIDVAAHSSMVEPILAEFEEFVSTVRLQEPKIPLVSNVSGTWIRPEEATDPAYWARHLRSTVRFADGLETLMEGGTWTLLEVGPGRVLGNQAQMHPAARDTTIVSSIRHPKEPASDVHFILRSLGQLWAGGVVPDWDRFHGGATRRRVALPTYPFEKKTYLIPPQAPEAAPSTLSPAVPAVDAVPAPAIPAWDVVPAPAVPGWEVVQAPAVPVAEAVQAPLPEPPPYEGDPGMSEPFVPRSRKERIIDELRTIFHELSGIEADQIDAFASFLELGFDSLFLAQVNGDLKRRFKVKVTVRQLMEKASSMDALSDVLDEKLPADFFPPEVAPSPPTAAAPAPTTTPTTVPTAPTVPMAAPSMPPPVGPLPIPAPAPGGVRPEVQALIQQQLQLMQQQLQLMGMSPGAAPAGPSLASPQAAAAPAPAVAPAQAAASAQPAPQETGAGVAPPPSGQEDKPVVHGPWKPVDRERRGGLEERQQKGLEEITREILQKTARSKEFVSSTRRVLADPRSVVGFRSDWKELVYPLVCNRAKGSKLWDIDGNEYIDIVGAFGVNLLGHSPEFVTEAVRKQLESGFAIGPQIEMAGKCAQLVSELTGMERVSFCNTGSEAVLAALRIARTVTGNTRIASFKAHYHGIFDEVLVKAVDVGGNRKNFPIAPGIPQWAVDEALVLDYGNPASLQSIRDHADELACVILEPVRSRNPDLQPFDFVRELRALTRELGIPLIFDEMITGFRCHLGGAQALLGVDADIATYGKVVGGGYPIGVVAGRPEFMDALDGGHWEFGDDSVPEADMTWFAGTFVRHPVSMTAAYASLTYLKEQGPGLQEGLNARTDAWVRELNDYFETNNIPVWLEHFSSFFMVTYTQFQEYSDLLPYYLMKHGVVSRETRPLFFSIAHTDEDWEQVAQAHKDSFAEMQAAGLMTGRDGAAIPVDEVSWTTAGDGTRELPLTEPQYEVWVASQFGDEATAAFNLSIKLPIRGEMDVDLMKSCLQGLVNRHEALRTTFSEDGETQKIHREMFLDIPVIDLTDVPEEDREEKADAFELEEVKRPFDLVNGPLVRGRILKLGPDRWRVLFLAHHIITDGWSCGILSRDLGRLYSAGRKGEKPSLSPVMQLSEYVRHLRAEEQLAEREAAEEFWLQEYATLPPPMELPTDRPRPAVKTFPADRIFFRIEPKMVESWKAAANQHGATLFAFTFAAFSAFIYRITGQDDFAVGSDLAGQALVPGKDLVSHCVSFLPIRMGVDGSKPFTDLLAATRGKWFDVIEYQSYTYGTLIRKIDVPTDPSRVPLAAVAFNLDPSSLGLDFEGLEALSDSIPRQFEVNDLFVNLVQLDDGGIELQCTYNLDLFDEETVIRRMRELVVLLGDAAARPDVPVSELELLTKEDRELLRSWNDTTVDYPLDSTVHALVEAQARKTPDARALLATSGVATELSYGELDRKANALAVRLQEMGVGRDKPVVVCMERSAEMIVSLLAVLKSGGAYLPVDPGDPEQRQKLLIEDSSAEVVLTQSAWREGVPEGAQILAVDEIWEELEDGEPEVRASADSLAYIIYTSGSTGIPKGVMVEHRSVVNQLLWVVDYLEITPADIVLQKAPFSFDTAVEEIFPPLLAGATLLLARPDGQRDPAYLIQTIRDHEVTIADFVPSMLNEILGEPALRECSSLRHIVTGGEATTPALRDRFLEASGADLVNGYGPTEATVQASAHTCIRGEPSTTVPIGRPVANTQIHVLDRNQRPAPIGVPGELCIGGAQIARGYLNRPEQTAERFIPDPFSEAPEARLYRTGDLCRYRSDGELEFLGRIDHQVKLRGYRIELGEIEAALEGQPDVRQAVVEVREVGPNNPALVAYVTLANGGEPDPSRLQTALSASLPDHMVPQHWMILPSLPIAPSGKVDRKALPDPERASGSESDFVAPDTEMERSLAAIWEEVLGVERVGARDDFFRLGGHSILAIRVASRIRRDLGVELPVRRLFATPVLGPLAQELEGLAAAAALTAVEEKEGPYEEEVVI